LAGGLVKMKLSFNQLTGPIPNELGLLPDLSTLEVLSTRMTAPGVVPTRHGRDITRDAACNATGINSTASCIGWPRKLLAMMPVEQLRLEEQQQGQLLTGHVQARKGVSAGDTRLQLARHQHRQNHRRRQLLEAEQHLSFQLSYQHAPQKAHQWREERQQQFPHYSFQGSQLTIHLPAEMSPAAGRDSSNSSRGYVRRLQADLTSPHSSSQISQASISGNDSSSCGANDKNNNGLPCWLALSCQLAPVPILASALHHWFGAMDPQLDSGKQEIR
jgi:hypothetical protein